MQAEPTTNPTELSGENQDGSAQRNIHIRMVDKIARPILNAAAEDRLHYRMQSAPHVHDTSPMEALIRTCAGLAPWLENQTINNRENPEEKSLQREFRQKAIAGLTNLLDPETSDHSQFDEFNQNLVEAGLLALAMLRAPTELWKPLDPKTKQRLVAVWVTSRNIPPTPNNWVLFSAIIETAIARFGGGFQKSIIQSALKKTENWYVGDGLYKDGNHFRYDYYNSFIVLPFLWEITKNCGNMGISPPVTHRQIGKRLRRQAEIQEAMISPEGTFPVLGRSSTYRSGAFHTLSTAILSDNLPESLSPGATRNALTECYQRLFNPHSFDHDGWLHIGICAEQPRLRDFYISTGSLYFCLLGFAHLGLAPTHPFWTQPNEDWTQKKIWEGKNIHFDPALHEPKSGEIVTNKLRWWGLKCKEKLGLIHMPKKNPF